MTNNSKLYLDNLARNVKLYLDKWVVGSGLAWGGAPRIM